MPLDLNFENKLIGVVPNGSRQDRKTLIILTNTVSPSTRKLNLIDRLRSFIGFLDIGAHICPGNCATVSGVARFYKTSKYLVCDQMWSEGLGPLLILTLAKRAHNAKLVLLVIGPFTEDARCLLDKAKTQPLPKLAVRDGPQDTYVISYRSDLARPDIRAAYERFRGNLNVKATSPVHGHRWHTVDGIRSMAERDKLAKAPDAHRK